MAERRVLSCSAKLQPFFHNGRAKVKRTAAFYITTWGVEMLNTIKYRMLALFVATLCCTNVLAALPVIPGAAGFGMNTPAGRGGKIIRVTNLNDSGQGSLRACVTASGPRVCIFEVSGTIRLESKLIVSNPYLTVAGQTAPAPGVMLRGFSFVISASNVLVQHLAVRVGDDPNGQTTGSRDSLKINNYARDVVVDHCSLSWALDENIETWKHWDNVTISNTIISEALAASSDGKAVHSYGALIHSESETSKISFIGNLFAHNHARNPRSNAGRFVFVNNVVYNPAAAAVMLFNADGLTSENSIFGNVFIDGRNTAAALKPIRLNGSGASDGNEILAGTRLYLADNLASSATSDPWSIVDNQSTISLISVALLSAPPWPDALKALKGNTVLDHVLKNSGSRPAQRNSVDARVIADVKKGSGQIINCVASDGTSECMKNAGGWPILPNNSRRLDVPSNPNADDDGDGYTNMEEWLHAMSAEVEGGSTLDQPGEPAPPRPPTLQTSP